ncbi:shikimate dehydrogenase [Acidipila sp. EB88]|uniref:shikimate dehydrogenase n=1 Tax=Acidipila sp. EB88 TaxID=2305226 RepID=UPI001315AC51|nr:shikimate dehydrogenase [Acidipila sp. EB88]
MPPVLPPVRRLRDHFAPVCVAVAAPNPALLFEQAATAVQESSFEAPLIELRMDALDEPEAGVLAFAAFRCAHPGAALLVTCRRTDGGGAYTGTPQEQLTLLARFAVAGASVIDLELETLEVVAPSALEQWADILERSGTLVLVSAHDFERTGDLDRTLRRLRTLGKPCRAAVYKVVSTAERLADNLAMLEWIERASREVPVVGICMGEAGLPSRVLALSAGALFTFAATSAGAGTAPGQVTAEKLLRQYRADLLRRAKHYGVVRDVDAPEGAARAFQAENPAIEETRLYGVAGNPVSHSLSPAMHNAAFQAAGVDAVYLPLHTTSVDDLLAFAKALPLSGLSVTMPWKVDILPFLAEVDPLARSIGAVNTVVRREDGSLLGMNTDAAAVVEPLRQYFDRRAGDAGGANSLDGLRVLLLGAGGAARAAAFGLRAEGALVSILNRTLTSAEHLAQESGTRVHVPDEAQPYDAVINATPAGMLGQPQALPLVDAALLRGVRVVFEMVYRPTETPLTLLAHSLGIDVIYGLEMFVHQGMRQWELWTAQPAPMPAMRAALEQALQEQEAAAGDTGSGSVQPGAAPAKPQ